MMESLDLRKVWIFEGLNDEESEQVAAVVEYRHCPAESHVVEAGTADRNLFVVLSGSVRIVTQHADGGESPIAEVLPGQHFGEVCFVDGGARTATAITNESTELLVIEPRRFARFAESRPMAAYKILWSMLRLLCGRLRNTDHWLFELMRG
jgi:CRP/FNR family transcriptional regulator